MEEHLTRQVVSVILYNRRFTRVSRPALDILAQILELALLRLWRQSSRIAEFYNSGPKAIDLRNILGELLRVGEPLFWNKLELLEFAREQPQLDYPSILEDRGLISAQLKVVHLAELREKDCLIWPQAPGREDSSQLPDASSGFEATDLITSPTE